MAQLINKISVAWDVQNGIASMVKRNGKKELAYINNTPWYFYIRQSDYEKAKNILQDYKQIIYKTEPYSSFLKIYINMAYQWDENITNLRTHLESVGVEVFEYDFNKTKRYMTDNNVPIETDLNILYFDIETDDSAGGISIGRDRILSWAGCDKQGNIFFETGEEKDILKKFLKLIDSYDIISGWNSEEFDLPYIKDRCEKYGLKYNWKSIIHIDMLQRCFKVYGYEANIIGLKNFSLNEIARCFLNKTKVDTKGVKVHELFRDDKEKLKEYNIQDTVLLKELDAKLGITDVMIMECALTGSFLFKFYIGELLDNYIIREAKKKGLVLKSKPSFEQRAKLDEIQITGGYVAEPKNGLYHHVNICDFKSLYPSIIVGWNIGSDSLDETKSQDGYIAMNFFLKGRKIEQVSFKEWDTFLKSEKIRLDPDNEYIQSANNSYFSRSNSSFIGDLVEKLLNERAMYKKKLKTLEFDTPEYNNTYATERVVKEMANSMFGITCDKSSRYFNQHVSEAITYTGQYLNKLSSYLAESLELTSIYGDTDSIFLIGVDDLSTKIGPLNDALKTFLDMHIGLRKNIVYIEYEKHFKKLMLMEKKRYTGLLSMKDGKPINKVFSRGTEDVKKSNTQLGKKTFTEFVSLLFKDDFSLVDANKYIKTLQNKLRYDDIDPEQLLITTRVSKSMDNYKVMSSHSRLAKRLIESGDLLPIIEGEKKVGTRLEYVMIDNRGVNDGVLLSEYKGNFNRQYYWTTQIYAPLKRLLKCTYPKEDWDRYDEFSDQLSMFE